MVIPIAIAFFVHRRRRNRNLDLSNKCYKLYQNASSYDDAASTCKNSGLGSQDAQLVSIRSYNELVNVKGMCRGAE